MIKKPMLASAITTEKHYTTVESQLPLLASVKLDGIRALHHPEHGFVSRKFKPIPNDYIRNIIESTCPLNLDGELVTLDANGKVKPFNELTGDIMRKEGTPDFQYIVFDNFTDPTEGFLSRHESILDLTDIATDHVIRLKHTIVTTMDEVYAAFDKAMADGYEGLMLRHPGGPYKEGRSTVNQCWLVKMKQFADAEGTVVSFEERMHNGNEAKKDATGHTDRSSHKENMTPMGTLGALVLDTQWGALKVGSGFSDELRKTIWENQSTTRGKIVTFTYQPFGAKDKPRFPIFKGFRHEDDIS